MYKNCTQTFTILVAIFCVLCYNIVIIKVEGGIKMKKLLIGCFLLASLSLQAKYEETYGVGTPVKTKAGSTAVLVIEDNVSENRYHKVTGSVGAVGEVSATFEDACSHYLNVGGFRVDQHDFLDGFEIISIISDKYALRIYLIKDSISLTEIALSRNSQNAKNFLLYLKANKLLTAPFDSMIEFDLLEDVTKQQFEEAQRKLESSFGGI